MRPSLLSLCLAALSAVSQAAAQSSPASLVFLAQQAPGALPPISDSRTSIPPLLRAPVSTYELRQRALIAYLRPIPRCYVMASRQFSSTDSNFNPAASTTYSTCQPASQYHLKSAIATPAR